MQCGWRGGADGEGDSGLSVVFSALVGLTAAQGGRFHHTVLLSGCSSGLGRPRRASSPSAVQYRRRKTVSRTQPVFLLHLRLYSIVRGRPLAQWQTGVQRRCHHRALFFQSHSARRWGHLTWLWNCGDSKRMWFLSSHVDERAICSRLESLDPDGPYKATPAQARIYAKSASAHARENRLRRRVHF